MVRGKNRLDNVPQRAYLGTMKIAKNQKRINLTVDKADHRWAVESAKSRKPPVSTAHVYREAVAEKRAKEGAKR